jgi:nitrogen fixation NifU-like protein
MATPYDDVILDHIKNARNYRAPERIDREIRGSNALCGDELVLYLQIDADCIVDISFQCACCGLSMASASVMTEIIKGKSAVEAGRLLREFTGRLGGAAHSGRYGPGLEQQALLDVAQRFPARARCVALPWNTLLTALAQAEQSQPP